MKLIVVVIIYLKGGNPGLVVMEGDSHSRGRGYKSPHQILDGHFTRFIAKIVMFLSKDLK